MTTHIEVSKKTRITITPDADPLNPRTDIECVTGYFRPIGWGGQDFSGPQPVFTFPGPLQLAHDRLWGYHYVEQEQDVKRWARINYGLHLMYDEGGYWFVNRGAWDMLVGTDFSLDNQEQAIKQDVDLWKAYVAGKAQVVTLERRATFKRITPSRVNEDDLLHVWEKVDQIGDVYVDLEYGGSYARVCTDHFGHEFTKKERAIFRAMLDAEAVQNSES